MIVGIVLAPFALWTWVAVETRARALETAVADQVRDTQSLAQHALRLLETQAVTLDLVDREAGERDCAALRADSNLEKLMAFTTRRMAPSESIRVNDAEGYLCASGNPALIDSRSRAFREYFTGAREAGPGHYYLERAVKGLVDGNAIFNVAKARTKGGEFNGVVLISVSLPKLSRSWSELLGVTPGQRMMLIRNDGAVIARSWPPLVPDADPTAERRLAATWRTATEGTKIGLSIIDGSRRVGAWRSVPDWGVVVWSSVEEAEVLRPWRRSMFVYATFATLAATLLGGLTWALLRGQRMLEATRVRHAHAQRMEALGQLAGGIAHDFNNILQAVQGGAALIERRIEDPERVRSLARMVSEAAGRGAGITRRLLAFSRQSVLQTEPIDAASLLAGMRDILTHTIGSGIDVRVDVEAGLPPLLADKGQLETVLVNLATNARDAMPSGGTLTFAAVLEQARQVAGLVYPVTLPADSYVRLCVSDSGAGMTPEVLARASEPFFTTKRVGQGTGLGLAMARGFAEQSGGRLDIDSAPGRGTAVNLWFPAAKAAALAAVPPPRHESPVGVPTAMRRLLMVDDDPIVRETLAHQMEAEGYAVLTATSGAEALALLDAGEAIDLVVTDLSMPGMDGLTLIRETHRRRPGMPAILLTGFSTNAAGVAISKTMSGNFTLLQKPIAARLLAERVAVLLEHSTVGAVSA